MRYIRIDKYKTTYIEGMRKVHETNYSNHNVGSDASAIVYSHIHKNIERLGWIDENVCVFEDDGETVQWQWLSYAVSGRERTFRDAYNAAKNREPKGEELD